jgi:hypothetical protein
MNYYYEGTPPVNFPEFFFVFVLELIFWGLIDVARTFIWWTTRRDDAEQNRVCSISITAANFSRVDDDELASWASC